MDHERFEESAERCGIASSTARCWRHRFMAAVRQAPDRRAGIVEADETFVLESRKGERSLNRKPRRQGPQTRPLSRAGADPGRRRPCGRDPQPYPARSQRRQREGGAGPVLAPDVLLVSDANRCYPPVAAALDIPHESINASAGERVRGALHIQTVNSRHSQIKGFPRSFRGIATKYLDSYLRWLHRGERSSAQTDAHARGVSPTSRARIRSESVRRSAPVSRNKHSPWIEWNNPQGDRFDDAETLAPKCAATQARLKALANRTLRDGGMAPPQASTGRPPGEQAARPEIV